MQHTNEKKERKDKDKKKTKKETPKPNNQVWSILASVFFILMRCSPLKRSGIEINNHRASLLVSVLFCCFTRLHDYAAANVSYVVDAHSGADLGNWRTKYQNDPERDVFVSDVLASMYNREEAFANRNQYSLSLLPVRLFLSGEFLFAFRANRPLITERCSNLLL